MTEGMARIIGPVGLIKESLGIFFRSENLAYLVKVTLAVSGIQALVVVLALFVSGLIGVLSFVVSGQAIKTETLLFSPVNIIGLLLVSLAGVWASIFGQAVSIQAVYKAINNEIVSVRETIKTGRALVTLRLFALQAVLGVIVILGLAFFIFPGLIVVVWTVFASFVLVLENRGVIDSLRRSRELVQGYFWSVVGYSLLFWLFAAMVGGALSTLVPLVGIIILWIFSSYFLIFPLLLYRELVKVKGFLR